MGLDHSIICAVVAQAQGWATYFQDQSHRLPTQSTARSDYSDQRPYYKVQNVLLPRWVCCLIDRGRRERAPLSALRRTTTLRGSYQRDRVGRGMTERKEEVKGRESERGGTPDMLQPGFKNEAYILPRVVDHKYTAFDAHYSNFE